MPLQNRVDPFGELMAAPSRGLFFGNRGGRFHADKKTLTRRRWASKQWICCVLQFKNRQHDVWGHSYTALFFLDEVTALAAGHRPCFECRRRDANEFAARWRGAFKLEAAPHAPEMDAMLHAERLDGRKKRLHRRALDELPDGTMISRHEKTFAICGEELLHWTFEGYGAREPRPRSIAADVLTPSSIVAVLAAGYHPVWHPSGGKSTA